MSSGEYDNLDMAGRKMLEALADAASLKMGVVDLPGVELDKENREEQAAGLAEAVIDVLVWGQRNKVPVARSVVEQIVAMGRR